MKSRHKKSFSADTFNIPDAQNKFYDNFKTIKPPEDFLKLLKEGNSRNYNEVSQNNVDFGTTMGTSTPNRNKKLNFFPNLAKINETGVNLFTNPQENSRPKLSISDLPNPTILISENNKGKSKFN